MCVYDVNYIVVKIVYVTMYNYLPEVIYTSLYNYIQNAYVMNTIKYNFIQCIHMLMHVLMH